MTTKPDVMLSTRDCMELIVLYKNEKHEQTWALYAGGKEEADRERRFMEEKDDTLEEVARFEVTKSARVVFFNI